MGRTQSNGRRKPPRICTKRAGRVSPSRRRRNPQPPLGLDRRHAALQRRAFRHLPARADRADDPGRVSRASLREVQEDGGKPLERVFVRIGQRLVPVRLADVSRLDADGDYVALVLDGRRHLLGMTLSALLPRLDPARFVRIHRSHVVNLDFVAAIRPHDAGRYLVEQRDGAKLVASRSGTQALRAIMG